MPNARVFGTFYGASCFSAAWLHFVEGLKDTLKLFSSGTGQHCDVHAFNCTWQIFRAKRTLRCKGISRASSKNGVLQTKHVFHWFAFSRDCIWIQASDKSGSSVELKAIQGQQYFRWYFLCCRDLCLTVQIAPHGIQKVCQRMLWSHAKRSCQVPLHCCVRISMSAHMCGATAQYRLSKYHNPNRVVSFPFKFFYCLICIQQVRLFFISITPEQFTTTRILMNLTTFWCISVPCPLKLGLCFLYPSCIWVITPAHLGPTHCLLQPWINWGGGALVLTVIKTSNNRFFHVMRIGDWLVFLICQQKK